jgi:hypothetical protein
MNTHLNNLNNILVIKNNSMPIDILSNQLINKITSLNNIHTKYEFTNILYESELTDIFEKQKLHSNNPILLYLNNCINTEIANSKIFKNIILNGRHYNIFIILVLQHDIHFSPQLRINLDSVFVFKDESIDSIKNLYDNYFGFIPSIEDFNESIKKLKDDEFLYSKNNNLYKYKIEKNV